MLICKGTRVRLHLLEPKRLVCPRGSMLHDPSGRWWSRNSLLIGGFDRAGDDITPDQYSGAPKDYLGREYEPRKGYVQLPPKRLVGWDDVGVVSRIDYVRPGTRAPGGYQHHFGKPRGLFRLVHLAKGERQVMLRKCGRFYRIDLGPGSIADERGIAFP